MIELLVVVVIIGILASVAIPNFAGAQDKAKNSAVQANAHTVQLALEQYGVDKVGQYPTALVGATNVIDSTSTYLKTFPKTPWNQQQAADIPLVATLTNQNLNVNYAGPGSGTAAPSTITHFGGVLYTLSGTAADQYVLAAVGKFSNNPGLVIRVSNR